MTQHIQKLKGFKATSTFPGFENCRIITVDHRGVVHGIGITQNQLTIKRLLKMGKKHKRKATWVYFNIPAKELEATREFVDDVTRICQLLNYPKELFDGKEQTKT